MLKTLSKSNRYPISLGGATFLVRALSGREFRKLEALQGSTSTDVLFDFIRSAMEGWDNVLVDDPKAVASLQAAGAKFEPTSTPDVRAVMYDPALLDVILDLSDAGELLKLMVDGNRPSKAELGKSDSPAPSTPA